MSVLDELELENVRTILDEYCKEFDKIYKQKLSSDGKAPLHLDNIEIELELNGSNVTVILNVPEYYKWIESGRKPYGRGSDDYLSSPQGKYPPIASIKEWIKEKNIVPREQNGKLPTEDQLAFLISRKIAYKGIEPGNLKKETILELNSKYIERLRSALKDDFGVYQLKVLNEINKMIKI